MWTRRAVRKPIFRKSFVAHDDCFYYCSDLYSLGRRTAMACTQVCIVDQEKR